MCEGVYVGRGARRAPVRTAIAGKESELALSDWRKAASRGARGALPLRVGA